MTIDFASRQALLRVAVDNSFFDLGSKVHFSINLDGGCYIPENTIVYANYLPFYRNIWLAAVSAVPKDKD